MIPETSPSLLTTNDETEIKSRTQAALEFLQHQKKMEIHNLGRMSQFPGTVIGMVGVGLTELILLLSSKAPSAPVLIEKWADFVSQSPGHTFVTTMIPVLAGAVIGNQLGTNRSLLKGGAKREQAVQNIEKQYEIEEAGEVASISAQIAKRREIANRST